ncbi:hypothetical protein Tco_0743358 [Tanacetum coccineum]
MRGMDVGSVNVPYLLARYLRLFAAERKSGAHIFGGQFVARLAEHFGLLTAKILQGLTVIAPELPIIDMAELVRLQICMEVDDTWAWVTLGPERQPDAVVGALGVAQDAHVVDEGVQADPTPVQAPPPPPLPLATDRTMPQRMAKLEEDVHEIYGALTEAGVTYMSYSETPREYQRQGRKKEEAQQKKFLENLKQLHINLPFIEALAQMPKYAKFLKEGWKNQLINQTQEDCEPVECNNNNDSNKLIPRIVSINTPYSVVQETAELVKLEREHLYSASANEIDKKKPEQKDLPNHLEYAYLHGDKSFPIIISSELSDKKKMLLLQVLEKRKGAIDSSWVSPIHVVPKKGGMTVVLNDNNELIPSRTVTGWRKGSYGPQFSKAYSEASHIDNFIPQKEKDPGRASVSVMPFSTYLNLRLGELAHTKLTVELASKTVKYPNRIAENVLVVPLILKIPFLSTARAKVDIYKRKITLRIGEERIIFKSVKPANSLIKRVYMLSLRERMELDLEVRLMGETLVINISLDPLNGDYIELNDLNEPFELRRNQGDDLMPTIEEGEVIEKFKTRDDELDTGIDDYPSYCDYDKKIHIDCAHNLKFSCMIGF